jgi:hypothetical protein
MLYIRIKLQSTLALNLYVSADILFCFAIIVHTSSIYCSVCCYVSQTDIYNFDVHYQYVSKAMVFSISSENLVVFAIVNCRHIFCGRVIRDSIIEYC